MLGLAIEGRKRVKDQLKRIDSTYPETDFSYSRLDGVKVSAATLEESEYPDLYLLRHKSSTDEPTAPSPSENAAAPVVGALDARVAQGPAPPQPGHRTFAENQKGVSFETLFWPWLVDASRIVITDPYIRAFHQAQNMMEFVEMIALRKAPDQHVELHLITAADEFSPDKQAANLSAIAQAAAGSDITFTWEIDRSGSIHARHIVTNTGWKIGLDRGLDISRNLNSTMPSVCQIVFKNSVHLSRSRSPISRLSGQRSDGRIVRGGICVNRCVLSFSGHACCEASRYSASIFFRIRREQF